MTPRMRIVTAYHEAGPHPRTNQTPSVAVCNVSPDGTRPVGFSVYDTASTFANRNQRYCELSAQQSGLALLDSAFVGLQHYRRFFIVGGDISRQWKPGIFKLPFWDWDDVARYGADEDSLVEAMDEYDYCTAPRIDQRPDGYPSMLHQFLAGHPKYFLEALDMAVRELHPDLPSVTSYLAGVVSGPFFNMFLARRPAASLYEAFLYPVLLRCEEQIGEVEDAYQKRYAGFLAERLQGYWVDVVAPQLHISVGQMEMGFVAKADIYNSAGLSKARKASLRASHRLPRLSRDSYRNLIPEAAAVPLSAALRAHRERRQADGKRS